MRHSNIQMDGQVNNMYNKGVIINMFLAWTEEERSEVSTSVFMCVCVDGAASNLRHCWSVQSSHCKSNVMSESRGTS